MATERSIEKLQESTTWTDTELDRLIDALQTAADALDPLGSHFALARNEIVRRLESAKSIRWHRQT